MIKVRQNDYILVTEKWLKWQEAILSQKTMRPVLYLYKSPRIEYCSYIWPGSAYFLYFQSRENKRNLVRYKKNILS